MAAKKRKLSKAHLAALQKGLAKWKRKTGKANPRRKRAAAPIRKRRNVTKRRAKRHVTKGWWLMRSANGQCRIGFGTHAEAKAKAQAISDRTHMPLDMVGPFATRDRAKSACA